MRWLRRSSWLFALLLAAGVSCTSTDSLTEAPASSADKQSPQFGLVGDLTGTVVGTLGSVTDLLTCSPEPYAVTSASVGPKGGTIKVGAHILEIPSGALKQTVTIKAEQVQGSTNSVRFSPEGLRFEQPAQLTMSYQNCSLVLVQKKIVYTDEKLKILEVLGSLDLFKKSIISAPIDHFSRYAVAY